MKLTLGVALATLMTLIAPSAASASIFVTDFDNGTGNPPPIPGVQAWTGQLGDDFTTTAAITITRIGVFDSSGNGTAGELTWRLFNVGTGAMVFEQEVPASGPRPPGTGIASNYVFFDLPSPLSLAAGVTYSAVAFGFDGADPNFNTNFAPLEWDVDFSTDGLIAAGGRYSGEGVTGEVLPGTPTGGGTGSYNFGAATFDYTTAVAVVPEPSTIAVWSLLGAATTVGAVVKRRRSA